MKSIALSVAAAVLPLLPAALHGQTLPLEIFQDSTRYNLQSTNGMPISDVVGTPPGSDGRAPGDDPGPVGTAGQFQSAVVFGGLVIPNSGGLEPGASFAARAEALDIPRSASGTVIMISARVGAPFVSRRVAFLFGSIISRPVTDEYGVDLDIVNTNVAPNRPIQRPEDYWAREPYTTNSHASAPYYWSPHAQTLFATSAGQVAVVWRKAAPSVPQGTPANTGLVTNEVSGSVFTVYTNRYLVSGSPVKSPRKIYWTEKVFRNTGKPVAVPATRVGDVHIAYNNSFPEKVGFEYQPPGLVPITNPTNTLQELRTLWYDQNIGQILAYNHQGRVFLELLGDSREDGQTRQHLGFEIVDVIRQPNPSDVTIELGELVTAHSNGHPSDSHLNPEPIVTLGQSFTYRRNIGGVERPEYYAVRETRNVNDVAFHWTETGLEGLRWPVLLVRYKLEWPADVARYSHYVRPLVGTVQEARQTSVALPAENAPIIDYQDPLDQPRGFLTERFEFYTFLSTQFPAHRTLLRYTAGDQVAFERVFSWLDVTLKDGGFQGTIATNLSTWNPGTDGFDWLPDMPVPRTVSATVHVGDRVGAPSGELGGGLDPEYVAGHIRVEAGDTFNPWVYADPFIVGFEAANRGAIIPVNAAPGNDHLEVWWFRRNMVNNQAGFKNTLWPAVIGHYTVEWPSSAPEIVLAGNSGSGPLVSLQAKGSIYVQNDASLPGYNPNEEHALMQGGQIFALRDDLNIVTEPDYSSEPFVLLEYEEADGRPAMRAFKVVREKPGEGILFDYTVDAGTILQAPMPLPLMEKPMAPSLIGAPPLSLNTEAAYWTVTGSDVAESGGVYSWEITTDLRHYFQEFETLALQLPEVTTPRPRWFYATNVTQQAVHGFLLPVRPWELSEWTGGQPADTNQWRYAIDVNVIQSVPLLGGDYFQAVIDPEAEEGLWLTTSTAFSLSEGYLQVAFSGGVPEAAKSAQVYIQGLTGVGLEDGLEGARAAFEPLPEGVSDPDLRDFYASFTVQDRKGNVWVYRGPHDEADDPVMAMQFYYKTLPGFFFPTRDLDDQPPVGTVTPYLRAIAPGGGFEGDPIFGNHDNGQDADGNALAIRYRPAWPENAPVLQMAETLTLPKRGLPAIRGQSSLEILYQQPQVSEDVDQVAAVLHDPTREKIYLFGSPDATDRLTQIPSSVNSQAFRGRTYFPNLPPHLAERFFVDPNRGQHGGLVFAGEFVNAPVGDRYLLLNVIGEKDAGYLKELCHEDDSDKDLWDAMVDEGLVTVMELFVENPGVPGTFIAASGVTVGPGELAEVTDDEIAVDSYALTAVGPGVGYVSLISGNGQAFTSSGDPVSVHVIRVVDTLYRGEVNVIASSNPLNEKLTLQQVVDLAGRAEGYQFEWRIAAPVDGLPPAVYVNTPQTLLAGGTWNHVRFPLPTDLPSNIFSAPDHRVSADVVTGLIPINRIPFSAAGVQDGKLRFTATELPHRVVAGTRLVMRSVSGAEMFGVAHPFTTAGVIVVEPEAGGVTLAPSQVFELYERFSEDRPQAVVFREATIPAGNYSQFWLSLDLNSGLKARVYIDGQEVVVANMGAGDTPTTSAPGGLFPLSRSYRLAPAVFAGGSLDSNDDRTHRIVVELFSQANPGAFQSFNLRLEAFESVDVTDEQWLLLDEDQYRDGVRAIIGGGADVRALADNYLIMRYQAADPDHASWRDDGEGGNEYWSQWTEPQLAEGWIKRVLAGINPFNQRVTDLFNNQVSTEVSIIAQAGPRWEGDVALNLDVINEFGLIEIYETVLNRGKMLSIGSGINYGPANDALLLAAGYLNDLYMMVGNEAWADASNPTIGIGSKDSTYGDIATALFAFRGQLASLLDEELALLRGRDDFLLPGVELRPVYNRLIWNYTRGIDAGEVIYALNYNILDQNGDGVVDADDARRLYPQGHGDAYGHYLTALKGYYALLLDSSFDWVPRIEAVTVLGAPVSVDFLDERKFAGAAAAVARAGRQVFDLTWRKDYRPGKGNGWEHFSETRVNTTMRNVPTTRHWGLDHWASRTGQGAYLHWIVGNAILPDVDPDPSHEGIQKIDRTTVPELRELVAVAEAVQTSLDNAEAGMTPLGLPETTIPFDLNPSLIVGNDHKTHFEQIYDRAKLALGNALAAFDDAKDVTRLLRSEEDSLADFRTLVEQQEIAYTNMLVEIYGTPYPDDIGPGRTYRTGYRGPDLFHYMYVDTAELETERLNPREQSSFNLDMQTFPENWLDESSGISDFNFIRKGEDASYEGSGLYIEFTLDSHGFFSKPEAWTGRRASPGRIQQAISDIAKARNNVYAAVYAADGAKLDLDWAIRSFERVKASHATIRTWEQEMITMDRILSTSQFAYDIVNTVLEQIKSDVEDATETTITGLPQNLIVGTAVGGDTISPARALIKALGDGAGIIIGWTQVGLFTAIRSLDFATETAKRGVEFDLIAPEQWNQELRNATSEIRSLVWGIENELTTINLRLQELDDARRAYQSLVAEGERVQEEREIFRLRSAAVVQGYRTRDAAFRIFRNEKLERYKTLFELAARYSFMAAQAFDYETGLLHTDEGKEFVSRIVGSRALGVMRDGEPQFAGSNTGDPGLSSAMAEMFADWLVLKGRLGFNNPDAYGTTLSLRGEHHRILPGLDGDESWQDVLNNGRRANLLDDPDVRRYCMQISAGNGLPVPGIVLEFQTVIADGLNLFGQQLAAGDHAFSPSSFATKIFAAGLAFEGYRGMDDPNANSAAGGTSPGDPSFPYLDPLALSATPYVYLIPVGMDSMRSPPLGDSSVVRSWSVDDVTVPLPFNIGGSDFSSKKLWQSSESLTEELFGLRKHQAFRPVSTASVFSSNIYVNNGQLAYTQFTNRRLIGRSVWNTKWKIVIPGQTLLHNPDEGLDRFIQTVKDVRLHFVTYSYAGN